MIIAIYARKSRYSDTGESIENQISMCKEYAKTHFGNDCIFYEYEDEGFSGGNTNRPDFKKLLCELKDFDILICYRLDRISRSVSDFSIFLKLLEEKHVGFISIREYFDTSTPMGRAMIHIASVFSQLERETIAERIKDNKYKLARLGTWQGGITPLGYKSKQIINFEEGKKKTFYVLVCDNESADIVRLIYSMYMNYRSFAEVSRKLKKLGYKAPNGGYFGKTTLRNILINPVYAKNTVEVYNYFYKLGADIAIDKQYFDGNGGITAYLKTSANSGLNPIENWIISCSPNMGIIDGKDWIKVNKIIKSQTRTCYSKYALLNNIIYCANCGNKMYVKGNRKDKNNNISFYYRCNKCKLSFNGKILDSNVWLYITKNIIYPNIQNKNLLDFVLQELLHNKKQACISEKQISDIHKLAQKIIYDFNSLPIKIKRSIFLSIIKRIDCSKDKITITLKL